MNENWRDSYILTTGWAKKKNIWPDGGAVLCQNWFYSLYISDSDLDRQLSVSAVLMHRSCHIGVNAFTRCEQL